MWYQKSDNEMLSSAEKLAKMAQTSRYAPDNTIHQAFDLFIDKSPIPWLHIAEEVAKEAKRRGFRRLGIMGTRYLMESQVYPSRLEPLGIDWVIPSEEEREKINEIIFNELVYGRFLDESRRYLQGVIERLKAQQGCDAVVLGCTELPLIISDETSPLPTLDSTRILARAALRKAIEE